MPLDEIRQFRLDKLAKLKNAGVDAYPAKTARTHSIKVVIEDFDKLVEPVKVITIAGRLMARREQGALCFADIADGSGQMQILLQREKLGDEKDFKLFLDTTDRGDFIEVEGKLFRTKQGEKTVQVSRWTMLAKSLLPLPEKWHGLQDVEERFRKRYLDFIFNPAAKQKIEARSRIVQTLRQFMLKHDFLEVVTPTLQPLYGGASARPFKTHLHALNLDLFLRVAPELYLKRLLVGGFERVFEFTTNFRNEGMDRDHNPEFSVLEFYAAYQDLAWLMDFTEKLFEDLLTKVTGGLVVKYQGQSIDFTPPFRRARFADLLQEQGFNSEAADEFFKHHVRPKLIAPVFVHDYPAALLPLAKRLDTSEQVGAFQFYAGGLELIKAFSELNDPLDQRERFKQQENKRAKGDEDAQRLDEDFIEALEYGMPPAAGWGLGIDRLAAILTDSHSIREVMLFPLLKPK